MQLLSKLFNKIEASGITTLVDNYTLEVKAEARMQDKKIGRAFLTFMMIGAALLFYMFSTVENGPRGISLFVISCIASFTATGSLLSIANPIIKSKKLKNPASQAAFGQISHSLKNVDVQKNLIEFMNGVASAHDFKKALMHQNYDEAATILITFFNDYHHGHLAEKEELMHFEQQLNRKMKHVL